MEAWKLTPYPVTESEYRAIVERERAELYAIDDYLERLIEWSHPYRNPTVAEYLEQEPEDESAGWETTYAAVRAIIEAAIMFERAARSPPSRVASRNDTSTRRMPSRAMPSARGWKPGAQ